MFVGCRRKDAQVLSSFLGEAVKDSSDTRLLADSGQYFPGGGGEQVHRRGMLAAKIATNSSY
jgi:hypothetical protein